MQVRVITEATEISGIGQAWDRLVLRSGCPTPFASCDWYRCCLAQVAHPLQILTVWREHELVGIAPWWVREVSRRGIAVRQLEFIANQDTAWSDVIVRDGDREAVLAAMGAYLEDRSRCRWDVLSLSQWPEDSPNRSWLDGWITARAFPFLVRPSSHVPLVRIEGTWEAFLGSKPQRTRKTQRNIANRLAKRGHVTVECHREGPAASLMESVLAVSRKGWKYQEGKSLANRPDLIRFFHCLTDRAAANGWLFLWLLKVDGKPIAMEYDLADGQRVYALRSEFDEAYKDCSPGAYLEAQILQWLFASGWQEYSYGPGLNAYKLHWATGIKTHVVLDVFNKTWKGRSVALLETQFVPMAKRIRDAMQHDDSRSASVTAHD